MISFPERFDIAVTKRAWGEIGMERHREVWVARYQSNPVAAAIIEVGQTGTNLFRLLDSLRLVSLQPGGEAAFLGLIEKAKAWFLARGKQSFVYIWEIPTSTMSSPLGSAISEKGASGRSGAI